MTTSVRIVRAVPTGRVTTAETPIPIVVTIHWHRGDVTEMDAVALAWSEQAVQVEWRARTGLRTDWIPAQHVRRPGQPAREDKSPPRAPRKHNRW